MIEPSIKLNHQYLSHPDDDQQEQQEEAERMTLEEQEQAGRRLYLASKQGDTKQARELLKSRAASASSLVEFVAHDENDQTPLWIACQRGHREIVSILIDFGASKNARSRVRVCG